MACTRAAIFLGCALAIALSVTTVQSSYIPSQSIADRAAKSDMESTQGAGEPTPVVERTKRSDMTTDDAHKVQDDTFQNIKDQINEIQTGLQNLDLSDPKGWPAWAYVLIIGGVILVLVVVMCCCTLIACCKVIIIVVIVGGVIAAITLLVLQYGFDVPIGPK